MSTTFEVFPGKKYIPSFKALLDLSNQRLNEFLQSYNLPQAFLSVSLRNDENQQIAFTPETALKWGEDDYAWFFTDFPGGTDAYYRILDNDDYDVISEAMENGKYPQNVRQTLLSAIDIGHYWCFRRSAGQLAITNLTYGILAASLAELTEGVVLSWDSAWHNAVVPMYAETFFRTYFRPEYCESSSDKKWFQDCLDSLAE